MEDLGSTTEKLEPADGKPGLELQINDAVAEIAGIEPGDEVDVKIIETGDGDIRIDVDFPGKTLTDEQKTELNEALNDR